jgi:hypothetical protein
MTVSLINVRQNGGEQLYMLSFGEIKTFPSAYLESVGQWVFYFILDRF